MKKILISIAFLIVTQSFMRADEGMWIPMLLKQQNEKDMRAKGMRISADDIYDINNASLKDAIVLFGRGCTGEIVSDKGLMLTNHHCGYGNIQQHSSLEFNYLEKGFWAMSLEEELPNKGLTATILIRMEDVSKAVLEGVTDKISESERAEIIEKNIETITNEAVKGTHYSAVIKPFYYGNQYFMYINEVFKDIRLVGAPPSNIGKFGGDTDNWMWPRHTGDFSVFRIYTGPDGKPAEFSKDNIPYKPKKHLTISTKGYKKNDFTFVFGYPGTTEQFLTSQAVALKTVYENPIAIQLRDERLNIIKKHMDLDPLIRIQYAAKAASIANGWKKWIGENRGIKRLNTIAEKQILEAKFNTWANATPERKAEYGSLMADFKKVYDEATPYYISYKYFSEAAYPIEAVRFALSFRSLVYLAEKKETTESVAKTNAQALIEAAKSQFKGYQQVIDKESFAVVSRIYFEKHDSQYQPQALKDIAKKYKNNFNRAAEDIFSKSIFTSEEKILALLQDFKKKDVKKIKKDPIYIYAEAIINYYREEVYPALMASEEKIDRLYRLYSKGIMEMMSDKLFYPDANMTLRVTYGKVDDYYPYDGVRYDYFTTLDGIMEKENPDVYDYKVEPKLKELWKAKDYGSYADKDGSMHVVFIASNHTTGGNSGSPVLNADGHLIGINFDRNWEGTMSDVQYDPDQCRNISLDIRYCLFIIDKLAGAKHLIDEMTIVN